MEEGYRRGTVLGLTIAEIFILLVFLMLLALMGVNRYWGSKWSGWIDIIDGYTPQEVREALSKPDDLRQQIQSLIEQIGKLEQQKEILQRRIRTLEGREGATGTQLDETNEKLRKVERALADCERALAEARRRIESIGKENRRLQSDLANLSNRVRMIGKGTQPPCWYQRVEETNPITKASWREKPYYLFDIAVRDDHMEMRRLPVPEGRADDDTGPLYREEAEHLPLAAIPYGARLKDSQVEEFTSPIHGMGIASQIRTYSCVFFVRVWDETSAGAKDRWKQAQGVLQNRFGTYLVPQTILWRDRDKLPVNVPVVGQQ